MTEEQIEVLLEVAFMLLVGSILLTWAVFGVSHHRLPADAYEVWIWIWVSLWGPA